MGKKVFYITMGVIIAALIALGMVLVGIAKTVSVEDAGSGFLESKEYRINGVVINQELTWLYAMTIFSIVLLLAGFIINKLFPRESNV